MSIPVGDAGGSFPRWQARLTQAPGLQFEAGRRLQAVAPAAPTAGTLRVSYITVVRNAAGTVQRTLDSVAAQSWPHVEHIVLDGASTDGTLDILRQRATSLDYVASAPDAGLYDALNRAVSLAQGDLLCVLNADDWLTPDAAEVAARAYAGDPSPAPRLLCTAAWVHDGDRRSLWLPERIDASAVLRCANLCHNGVYAHRLAYQASGPYRTELRIAADFSWLVQCQRAGVQFQYLDTPTVHYQLGGMSSDKQRHTRECLQVLRAQLPELGEDEAWGLMHCFHGFDGNLEAFASNAPVHRGRFLQALARSHGDNPFLMQALALASAHVMVHPADRTPAGRLSRSEKLRRSLHKRRQALRALFGKLAR